MSAANFTGFLRLEQKKTYKERRSMLNHSMHLQNVLRKWDKKKLKMRNHKSVIGVKPAVKYSLAHKLGKRVNTKKN